VRGAQQQQIARLQGHEGTDVGKQARDAANAAGGVRAMNDDAVDGDADGQCVGRRHVGRGSHLRTGGAEAITRTLPHARAVVSIGRIGGDAQVGRHPVAGNAVQRLGLVHTTGRAADDEGQRGADLEGVHVARNFDHRAVAAQGVARLDLQHRRFRGGLVRRRAHRLVQRGQRRRVVQQGAHHHAGQAVGRQLELGQGRHGRTTVVRGRASGFG